MKICVLGEFYGHPDEGMRKLSFQLAAGLSKKGHEVLALDVRDTYRMRFWRWRHIAAFEPHIIQYVHGQPFVSLLIMKLLSFYYRRAKIVVYSTHPSFSLPLKKLLPLFKPDLILTQSYETEKMFLKYGCETTFLPAGVDLERFKPASAKLKQELREKYRLDKDKFIILHIGSIKKVRNVRLLERVARDDNQVIVVGSTSTGVEKDTLQHLQKHGCLVWVKYFENIEEIYALSDCYVFPTVRPMGSIELPLSVLEAMSCNLAVISTKFGALPRMFEARDGLIFADKEGDFIKGLEKVKSGIEVKNREKVLPYSWESIVQRLEGIYEEILRR